MGILEDIGDTINNNVIKPVNEAVSNMAINEENKADLKSNNLDDFWTVLTKPGRYVKNENAAWYAPAYKDTESMKTVGAETDTAFKSAQANAIKRDDTYKKQQEQKANEDGLSGLWNKAYNVGAGVVNQADNLFVANKARLGGYVIGAAQTGVMAADAVEGALNMTINKDNKTDVINSDGAYKAMTQMNKAWATGGNLTKEKERYAYVGQLAGELGIPTDSIPRLVGAGSKMLVDAVSHAAPLATWGGKMLKNFTKGDLVSSAKGIPPSIIDNITNSPVIGAAVAKNPLIPGLIADVFNAGKEYLGTPVHFSRVEGKNAGEVISSMGKIGLEALGETGKLAVAATTGLGTQRIGRFVEENNLMGLMMAKTVGKSIELLQTPISGILGKTTEKLSTSTMSGKIADTGIKAALGAGAGYFTEGITTGDWTDWKGAATGAALVGGMRAAPDVVGFLAAPIKAMVKNNPRLENVFRYTATLLNPRTLDDLISHDEVGFEVLRNIKQQNNLMSLDDLSDFQIGYHKVDEAGDTITYTYSDFLKDRIVKEHNLTSEAKVASITELEPSLVGQYLDRPATKPSVYADEMLSSIEKSTGKKLGGMYKDALKDTIVENCEKHISESYRAFEGFSSKYQLVGIQKAVNRIDSHNEDIVKILDSANTPETSAKAGEIIASTNTGIDDYISAYKNLKNQYLSNQVMNKIGSPGALKNGYEHSALVSSLEQDVTSRIDGLHNAISKKIDDLHAAGEAVPPHVSQLYDEVLASKEKLQHMYDTVNETSIVSRVAQLSLGYKAELYMFSDPTMIAKNYTTAVARADKQFTNTYRSHVNTHGIEKIEQFGGEISDGTIKKVPVDLRDVRELLVENYSNPYKAMMGNKGKTTVVQEIDAELAKGFVRSAILRNNYIDTMVLPEALRIAAKSGLDHTTPAGRKAIYNISRSIIRDTGLGEQGATHMIANNSFTGRTKIVKTDDWEFGYNLIVRNMVSNDKSKKTETMVGKEFDKAKTFMLNFFQGQYKASMVGNQIMEDTHRMVNKNGWTSLSQEDKTAYYTAISAGVVRSLLWGSKGSGLAVAQLELDPLGKHQGTAKQGETLIDNIIDSVATKFIERNQPILKRMKEISKSNNPKDMTEMKTLEKQLEKQTRSETTKYKWGASERLFGTTSAVQNSLPLIGPSAGIPIFISVVTKMVQDNITRFDDNWIQNITEGLLTRGVDRSTQGKVSDKIATGDAYPTKAEGVLADSAGYSAYSKNPMSDAGKDTLQSKVADISTQMKYISDVELDSKLQSLSSGNPDPLMKQYVEQFTQGAPEGSDGYIDSFNNAMDNLDKIRAKDPRESVGMTDQINQMAVNNFDNAIWKGAKTGNMPEEKMMEMQKNMGIDKMSDRSLLELYSYANYNNPQLAEMLEEIGYIDDIQLPDDEAEQILNDADAKYNKNVEQAGIQGEVVSTNEGNISVADYNAKQKIQWLMSRGLTAEDALEQVREEMGQ